MSINSDQIEASFDTLYGQSKDSAEGYLAAAVRHIDNELGEGYAKSNPALIAAFMHTAVSDFNNASNAKVMGAALRVIADSMDRIATGIENVATSLE